MLAILAAIAVCTTSLYKYCCEHRWLICKKAQENHSNPTIKNEDIKKPASSSTLAPSTHKDTLTTDFNILSNLSKSDEEKLDFLDKISFELASSVARDSGRRGTIKPTAKEALDSLRTIAERLRKENPKLYDKFSPQISDSLLDLQYALAPESAVSLRLSRRVLGPLGKSSK